MRRTTSGDGWQLIEKRSGFNPDKVEDDVK